MGGGVKEGGSGQPGIGGIHSSASTSVVSRSPTVPSQKKFLHPLPPAPSAAPAARPAGRLLLDAQHSLQPSETRRRPSGPSGPLRPHPALDEHSGWPPTRVSFGPMAAVHPTHVLKSHTVLKPHQFPAELAQEAVKPSAVHARAGAPARPASSSANSSGSGAERAGRAGQRRPRPLPSAAAPRSSLSVAPAAAATPTSGSRTPPLAPQPMGPGRG